MISTTNPHRNRKPRNISDEEWAVRVQLAAAYRFAAKFNLTDLIYTQISVRVPGTTDQFLINPHGWFFDEMTGRRASLRRYMNTARARVTGEYAEEVLLDAGYFEDVVIEPTLERDIGLLCPDGQWPAKKREEGLFHKSALVYHPQTDTYQCPAGQTLFLESKCDKTSRTRQHRVFAASNCAGCQLRKNCTESAKGRRIKRYPEDEYREALRLVMQHPEAQGIFSRPKAIVEPWSLCSAVCVPSRG